jgi:hypothetical protein
MTTPFRDNADRFGPKPDIAYPVRSKYDGALFYHDDGSESTAYLIRPRGGDYIFQYEIGNEPNLTISTSEYATFDTLRQAWLV